MEKVIFDKFVNSKKEFSMSAIFKKIFVYAIYFIISYAYSLTLKFNLGLFLFIPFLLYILSKDNKKAGLTVLLLFVFSYFNNSFEWISIAITIAYIVVLKRLFLNKKEDISYTLLISGSATIISYLTIKTFSYNDDFIYNIVWIVVIALIKSNILTKSLKEDTLVNKSLILHYQLLGIYAVTMAIVVSFSNLDLIYGINLGMVFSIVLLLILVHLVDTSYHYLFGISLFYVYYYFLNVESAIMFPVIILIYKHFKNKNLFLKIAIHYGVMISMYYSNAISSPFEIIFLETSVALLLYILVYENLIKVRNIRKIFISDRTDAYRIIKQRVSEDISSNLFNFSNSLEKFANNGIRHREEFEKQLENIEIIRNEVCNNCKYNSNCYGENNVKGLRYVLNVINLKEKIGLDNGKLFCVNANNIYEYVNSNKSFFDTKIDYKDKSKEILKEQILKISKTIKDYAINIDNDNIVNDIMLDKIKTKLKSFGLNILYVEKDFLNSKYTDIQVAVDSSITSQMLKDIKFYVNEHFEDNVTVKHNINSSNIEILHIRTLPNFILDFAFSYIGKNGSRISGDNFTHKRLKDDREVFALSDGMGSGKRAYLESKSILELLSSMLDSNISDSGILNILSSMLSLNDIDEQFSTLDYLVIDKVVPQATFYKIGGATSFLVRKNKVLTIENKQLPLGMLQEVEGEVFPLFESDVIIMVSDGVVEKIPDLKVLEEHIFSNKKLSSQELAHSIVRFSVSLQEGFIYDDMTVMVIKVRDIIKK